MTRIDIINTLIKKNNYKSYLEIGIQSGKCFNQIECKYKVGVDPDLNVKTTYNLTSDEFFKQNKEKFSCIFIDGLHIANQVYNDILNSLDILEEGGVIICHDMLPINEESQLVPRQTKCWMGDCWKAFVKLRYEREDLYMYTVDTDCGCGIIYKGFQKKIDKLVDNYADFEKNKQYLMNIRSVQEFLYDFNH